MNEKIKNYFTLGELFSQAVVKKYGEQAWSFLDPRLVDVLVWLREGLGCGLVCNTKTQQQRGFRENTCPMVADYTKKGHTYCSPHVLGKGVDVNCVGNKYTAEQMRAWISKNIKTCPYPIRIERTEGGKIISWCHIDVMTTSDQPLTEFDA